MGPLATVFPFLSSLFGFISCLSRFHGQAVFFGLFILREDSWISYFLSFQMFANVCLLLLHLNCRLTGFNILQSYVLSFKDMAPLSSDTEYYCDSVCSQPSFVVFLPLVDDLLFYT